MTQHNCLFQDETTKTHKGEEHTSSIYLQILLFCLWFIFLRRERAWFSPPLLFNDDNFYFISFTKVFRQASNKKLSQTREIPTLRPLKKKIWRGNSANSLRVWSQEIRGPSCTTTGPVFHMCHVKKRKVTAALLLGGPRGAFQRSDTPEPFQNISQNSSSPPGPLSPHLWDNQ